MASVCRDSAPTEEDISLGLGPGRGRRLVPGWGPGMGTEGMHVPGPPCSVAKTARARGFQDASSPPGVEDGGASVPGSVCSLLLCFAHIRISVTLTRVTLHS